jgi:hypothetical protein
MFRLEGNRAVLTRVSSCYSWSPDTGAEEDHEPRD